MRRFLSLFTMLMLCGVFAFAQSRVVSGKVTDKDGNPVPFATVKVKDSKIGVSADANGAFSIRVKSDAVLEISGTGFKKAEVPVGSQSILNAVLEKDASSDLKEVVVTSAFGKKTSARSATTNVQIVTGEQLNTIRQTDVNNALAGKIAGASVRSQSVAALGRSANVTLRGETALYGVGVLYVLDGTIVSASDINPDDVEDITVLNGPSAAALYGSEGSNGAIVVTRKKAHKANNGIGLEVNTGVTFDEIYIVPNHQNTYAGGGVSNLIQYHYKAGDPLGWQALDGKYYPDYTDDASWGPRMMGQEYIPWYAWYGGHERSFKTASLVPQPENDRDFYNIGQTLNNNINFSKAGDNYTARVSYTNLDVKGLIPNSYLKKNTFSAVASVDLSSRFTISSNITYINQKSNAENDDAYANQSSGSFNSWYHRDLDMNILKELRYLKTDNGIAASWNHANPDSYSSTDPNTFYKANYWYNFYTYYDYITNNNSYDRIFGDVSLSYKASNALKFTLIARKNQFSYLGESTTDYNLEISATQTGIKSGYSTYNGFTKDDRIQFLANYNKNIKSFGLRLLAGVETTKLSSSQVAANTRNGLYIPNYFVLSNSIDPIAYSNPRSLEKRRAAFFNADLDYKKFLYLTTTFRNDWFSTLPSNANSILTQSVGAGLVFSEFIKNKSILNFGKLKASWGQTPESVGPYQTALYYGVGADQWNGSFIMGTPNQISSSTVKGAVQTESEVGLELRFLKNRISLSGSYYSHVTKNSPLSVPVNGASGFTSKLINAGEIDVKGMELTLNLRPILTKNFSWDINATFGKKFEEKIVKLAPGVSQVLLSNGASFTGITTPSAVNQENGAWGLLIGGGKLYQNGLPVIDSGGFYVKDPNLVNFGSISPSYTGGIQNTINFHNFQLNINIDYSYGGKFFSLSDMWGSFSGLTQRTAVLNDKGNSIRDAVGDGGGIHIFGVNDKTGKPYDTYVGAFDYYHTMVNRNVYDEFVYDKTFVKLRELSLAYKIPVQKISALKSLQNATFSILLRNPWLIYAKTKDFDPSEIVSRFGENGQFPGTRSIGVNLKLGF